KIFEKNNYYGLSPEDIFIFQQGTFANFSFDGKILLADKDKISVSPDGHGGSLRALHRSGALKDMKKRGVKFVSYFQIDNPLVKIFDPLFIGLHALDNSQISSKAVIKAGPGEKVGSFCIADGKVTVIEYSDLPTKLACRRNPDDSLVFGLASIAIHIINLDFIEQLNASGFSELKTSLLSKLHLESSSHSASVSLPLHKAVKKIPHLDRHDNFIVPSEPNGIKLESFVFDALPLASKSIILQTLRGEEFGPVKNASGFDSAQIAKEMMICRSASWLESAGVAIPRKPDGSIDCVIEIAPSFALDRDDVKTKLNQIPKIAAGDKVYLS
ncbi:MAG: UTP--glucose-1-phosphate uridylyltransferase, partial [Planctomycetes bacterium]|nr:UTP--glucose-1-phosphate uridylyltransferase [Planctomycetota bacterium]